MENAKVVTIAQDFKETNSYILEGYLDMCQADLPRRKRCWLELHLDDKSFTDGKLVHLGLFTLKDVFDYVTDKYPENDPEAIFALLNEYVLGHENQHTRSTRNKDFEAAQTKAYRTFLSGISTILKDGKIFRKPEDYDAYVDELKKKGYDINEGNLNCICHYLVNSLEDGRIERIRSIKRPGFGTLMRFARAALYEMNSANEHLKDGTYTPDTLPKKEALFVLLAQILSLATASVYEKDFFSLFCDTQIGVDAHRMIPYIRAAVNSGCCRGIVDPTEELAKILTPYLFEAMEKKTMSSQTGQANERMKQTGSGSEEEEHTAKGNEEETDEGKSNDVLNSEEESLNKEGSKKEQSKGNERSSEKENSEEEGKGAEGTKEESSEEQTEGGSDSGEEGARKEKKEKEGQGNGQSEESGKESKNGEGKSKGSKESGESEYSGLNGSDGSEGSVSEEDSSSESDGSHGEGRGKSKEDDSKIKDSKNGKGGRMENFKERTAKGMEEGAEKAVLEALDKAMKDAAAQMNGLAGQISAYKAEARKKVGSVKETKIPEFKPMTTKTVFPGIKFKEVYRQYKLDTPMPYDLQVRADKFANDIDELFHNQDIPEVRCMNTGKIDPSGIYKLGLNMIDCFEQEKESPEFSGCAYFLCDNSGSMGRGKGSKRYFANEALAIIEQGFTKHMPIKMTAFDQASGMIIHECIKNWDEELPVSGAYNFAIKGRGGSGNADAYSIRVATEELLARSEEEKILVVMSDGAPSCVTYNGKHTAEDEVREAVEDARAAGIRVISIFFEQGEWRDDRTIKAFHYMYGKPNSIVCDPDEVEDELAELMHTFVFG